MRQASSAKLGNEEIKNELRISKSSQYSILEYVETTPQRHSIPRSEKRDLDIVSRHVGHIDSPHQQHRSKLLS